MYKRDCGQAIKVWVLVKKEESQLEWLFDVRWCVDLDPAFDSRAKTTHLEYEVILFMRLLGHAVLGFLQCVVHSGAHC